MANLRELAGKLRRVQKEDPGSTEQQVVLCFEIMELYSAIGAKFRTKQDQENCIYAAITLSHLRQEGLAARVMVLLNDSHLPTRAEQILNANLPNMAPIKQ